MTDLTFGFMNTKVKFKDDPKFIHIDETLKCLTYIFMHHLDIWISLCQNNTNSGTGYASMADIDAGKVFNNLLITMPMSSNATNKTEITDEQFNLVAQTFRNYIDRNPSSKMNYYAKGFNDPIECMWEFCHYLFVPVRLQHDTIPKMMKINSLRKWLTVSFTLPFVRNYTDKYLNAINNIQFLQAIYDKLIDDPTKIEKLKSIDDNFAQITIARVYNEQNPTQIFVRIYMNIVLMASIEIMKKYCPNYPECYRINPNYDGAWLNPFDPIFSEHLLELNNLTQLLSTKQK